MASLTDYFEQTAYKAKYEFMARVEGKYKNIPFVGSVGADTLISESEGPVYIIHFDLPMKVGKEYIYFIRCKHSEIKGLRRRGDWV
jgi:hypothetical protein